VSSRSCEDQDPLTAPSGPTRATNDSAVVGIGTDRRGVATTDPAGACPHTNSHLLRTSPHIEIPDVSVCVTRHLLGQLDTVVRRHRAGTHLRSGRWLRVGRPPARGSRNFVPHARTVVRWKMATHQPVSTNLAPRKGRFILTGQIVNGRSSYEVLGSSPGGSGVGSCLRSRGRRGASALRAARARRTGPPAARLAGLLVRLAPGGRTPRRRG
jgi:hypothetical protein